MSEPPGLIWCMAETPRQCKRGLGQTQREFAPHAPGTMCEGCMYLRRSPRKGEEPWKRQPLSEP